MALNLTDDIGVFNKSGLQDDLGILDNKPKLTGDPKIDMPEVNKAQASAQEAASPRAILDKVTGWPTMISNVPKGIGNIVNSITHPVDTLSGAAKSLFDHPIDNFKNYVSSRYGSMEKASNTAKQDPIGVLLDMTVIGGIGENLAKNAAVKGTISASKDVINKAVTPDPQALINKAESITQRILAPSKQDIADALLKNSKIPAVREAAKVIRQSPNEKALLTNIDDAIKTNFNERNSILQANNYKMTDNYISGLEDFINQRKAAGQVNPAELRQMENVLAEEKTWFVKNQDKFDRVGGQARKEYLQDVTNTLLEKRADGSKIITQPARKQALDALRSGLMKEVEGNDLRVRDLNATYGGLKDAREMLANQAAIIEQNAHRGIAERLLLMAQSATNPQALATKIAMDNAAHIGRMTAKVERLMQTATKNRIGNVINESIRSEKNFGLPYLTPKYLQERQTQNVQPLGTKTGPMENRPFQIKGVPEAEAKTVPIDKPSQAPKKGRTLDLTNKYSPKEILDESYKSAIEAKLKRMIKYK